jgi:hypothetical protein
LSGTKRVANKQTHCNPFQPILRVGWVIGSPHATYPN